jgi:hypothetical protein
VTKGPPQVFDGWRLDIDPIWESYNRIFFSYKRSILESEIYLRRLYRSHFVVFAYSFIDAVISKLLIQKLGLSKSQLKSEKFRHLTLKVERLHIEKSDIAVLDAYNFFWQGIEWLRNELIHPTRGDHLASIELDKLDVGDRLVRLNSFSVRAYQVADLEFPYWLTGWNSINSMTSDSVSQGIILSDNAQFKVFLQTHGWIEHHYHLQALETVHNYLMGEDKYRAIVTFLDRIGFETQSLPSDIGFSLMPIWSKQWWDRNAMEGLRAFRMKNSPIGRN